MIKGGQRSKAAQKKLEFGGQTHNTQKRPKVPPRDHGRKKEARPSCPLLWRAASSPRMCAFFSAHVCVPFSFHLLVSSAVLPEFKTIPPSQIGPSTSSIFKSLTDS